MLNSISSALVNHAKKKKDKNNSDKITFYIFKTLMQIFIIICLINTPGTLFNIFLKIKIVN
jgi:hypothetical protein